MKPFSLRLRKTLVVACSVASSLLLCAPASADEPGRGLTAAFETDFLKMIINHHYSALRITELAAGTDMHRDARITGNEGTAPTPDTAATLAKSTTDDIKSMARRNNRMQREEILTAQMWLRQWYGITYAPQLDKMGAAMIRVLEQATPGAQFDHAFLEVFSRHHYMALAPGLTCIVASDVRHTELQRYCDGIVNAQVNDIQDMREMLEKKFNIVDYQPIKGIRGVHSGPEQHMAD